MQKLNFINSTLLILGLEYFTKQEDFAHIKPRIQKNKQGTANMGFASMLVQWNNNWHLDAISYYPTDGILSVPTVLRELLSSSLVILFGFSCLADTYQIPTQQPKMLIEI